MISFVWQEVANKFIFQQILRIVTNYWHNNQFEFWVRFSSRNANARAGTSFSVPMNIRMKYHVCWIRISELICSFCPSIHHAIHPFIHSFVLWFIYQFSVRFDNSFIYFKNSKEVLVVVGRNSCKWVSFYDRRANPVPSKWGKKLFLIF